ncbi:MAG TPA: MFS transporter, partial [Polyangiaceae bacterium]|nr:MFS transporter [Polyangiaceae bacterium]
AAAFALAPLGLNAWIEAATWRGAWLGMAATVGLGMGGLGWLLFRDDPEQCGLRMDGDTDSELSVEEHTATRGEALTTTAFWALTLTLAVQALVITGFTFHILDIGETVGLSNTEVVSFFVPMAVFSTTTGIVVGWAADRTKIRTLIFVMLAAELVGYAGSANLGSTAGFWVAVVGMGVASGFFSPLSSVALPRLFGRTHLGAIAGMQTMAVVVGSALGPPAFALSASLTGGYASGLYACLLLPVIVTVLNAIARHPHDVPPTLPSE